MEHEAFRGDWFDAGLGLEVLGAERLPGVVSEGIEGALVLRGECTRLREVLRAWLARWQMSRFGPRPPRSD